MDLTRERVAVPVALACPQQLQAACICLALGDYPMLEVVAVAPDLPALLELVGATSCLVLLDVGANTSAAPEGVVQLGLPWVALIGDVNGDSEQHWQGRGAAGILWTGGLLDVQIEALCRLARRCGQVRLTSPVRQVLDLDERLRAEAR